MKGCSYKLHEIASAHASPAMCARRRTSTAVRCSAQPKSEGETTVVEFQTKEGALASASTTGPSELRRLMLDNSVDLYTTWGKVWQCGGYGQCGTCIVQVLEGEDLLTPKSAAELRHLRGKPESWRLACQTDVRGRAGKVVIKTKPQS